MCLTFALCLSACTYNPPEGWTKKHHTYEEVLTFAKSIDPNATVAEEYSDTVDENDWQDWQFREWDAVINGVHCHVASVSDWVWNEGFAAGEFVKVYYRIDTDYDYTIMQNILLENFPDWKCREGMRNKYHSNDDMLFAELTLTEYRMMSDKELERVWQTACEIREEFEKVAIGRKAGFEVPSPGKYWNHHGEQEYFVKKDSHAYIRDFSEEGKKNFIREYKEDWALLESGLPVYD